MQKDKPQPIRPDMAAAIMVDVPFIVVPAGLRLRAEAASALLDLTAEPMRVSTLERLLELGASTEGTYRTSMTIQLFEHRVDELGQALRDQLSQVLATGGTAVEQRLLQTLHKFEKDLVAWTTRYVDPRSADSLPSIASARMKQVTDGALQEIRQLLADGDDSALGRWADRITRQLQDSERAILAEVVQRRTTARTGVHKGRAFEEALSEKLIQVAVALGCGVVRCGDSPGQGSDRHGDHLLTFAEGLVSFSIVIEAKAHGEGSRFSYDAIEKECTYAKRNREASAAIFVVECREVLPDGQPFGQLSRSNFFVEYDPETGDDLGLVACLYLARAAALQSIRVDPSIIDLSGAVATARDIRELVEQRTRLKSLHASAIKAISNATTIVESETQALLVLLSRLDTQLSAANRASSLVPAGPSLEGEAVALH